MSNGILIHHLLLDIESVILNFLILTLNSRSVSQKTFKY